MNKILLTLLCISFSFCANSQKDSSLTVKDYFEIVFPKGRKDNYKFVDLRVWGKHKLTNSCGLPLLIFKVKSSIPFFHVFALCKI